MSDPTRTLDIAALNQRHAIAGQLHFTDGPGGLALAQIQTPRAAATIALHGAQVLHFQPHGRTDLLWLSRAAIFAPGSPIRGGIPICWPWFGPHPTDADKPQHGFVRFRPWQVLGSAQRDDRTVLRLGLTDDETTRALWPHAFELELELTVGATLELALLTRNPGPEPLRITAALHSYLAVGDIAAITIEGLEQHRYIDKVAGGARAQQHGPVVIAGETDRVYLDATGRCTIVDPQLDRRIEIGKSGSATTVVWNPWAEKSAAIRDMEADGYRTMVCVETANAADDVVTIAPGATHRLWAALSMRDGAGRA